ncbi:MAG: helix-turn-helix domain-containing protein [Patescibacteria group bacterium]
MTQEQALAILQTGANVFLTGEPGSGKTYTINEYARYLRERGIEPAITASTGIAATHIGGMTIHSWSGIGIKTKLGQGDIEKIKSNARLGKRIGAAHVLIIDEVSMLSAETLDMVDAVCRAVRGKSDSFGGLQIIFVGDFFQLPPIARRDAASDNQIIFSEEPRAIFSYTSSAWRRAHPIVCYLTEQHRQDDKDFLELLSSIRRNDFRSDHAEHIEKRKIQLASAPSHITKLFSHNIDVDRVNEQMLAKLPGGSCEFAMRYQGRQALVDAMKRGCLSPEILRLKIGAVVMFTKNSPKSGFVNGTLGRILSFDEDSGWPLVKTSAGRLVAVEPMEWTVEENGKVRARLQQLPLRLAWAMTVHKSQGMSLDAAIMDLSAVFEYGQGYVALSRVRRFSGLFLLGWNERAFQVHPMIIEQDEVFRAEAEQAAYEFFRMTSAEIKMKQENFILTAGGKPKRHTVKKENSDTYFETLLLLKREKTLAQIAEERGLKITTILGHMENLAAQGQVQPAELIRLLSSDLQRALPEIRAVFRELDTMCLSPVFERFQGAYSYDDLRMARMVLDA